MNIINQTIETVPIDSLRPHPKNPRRGNLEAITESISHNGFYGTVIAQKSTGLILAGNHRWLAAQANDAKEIPVIWLDIDDDHALRILLADNRTNDIAEYDDTLLTELLNDLAEETGTLLGTGYNEDDIDELLNELKPDLEPNQKEKGYDVLSNEYSRTIETPIYEPKGDKPKEKDLYDRTKTNELLEEIQNADLPKHVKDFLTNAAERHTEFRFDRIAEYYCHAPAPVQDLMERSALVIIDFNKAIEYGYVKLTKRMLEQVGSSTSEDEDDA